MTRKDYIAIAKALNSGYTYLDDNTVVHYKASERMLAHIANEVADIMAKDNSNFNRDRFMHAVNTGCMA